MDIIRWVHKALSDQDIGTILGADSKHTRYSELRHIDDLDDLLTKEYGILHYSLRRQTGHGQLAYLVKV